MTPSDGTSAPDPDGAARPRGAKHPVTARTKARRRAVEILFEADQRGLLRTGRGESPGRDEHGGASGRDEHGGRPAYDERPAPDEYDDYGGWDEYGARGDYDDYGGYPAPGDYGEYDEYPAPGEYGGRDGARAEESSGAARALRDLAVERAERSANHTPAPAYAREILAGVADHLAEVDDAIETYAQGWTLERMPAVDRAIARVATWEIVWNDDVDTPVAVDEAMTLARMLSTDDSPRYLGGLLGRIGDLADTLR